MNNVSLLELFWQNNIALRNLCHIMLMELYYISGIMVL